MIGNVKVSMILEILWTLLLVGWTLLIWVSFCRLLNGWCSINLLLRLVMWNQYWYTNVVNWKTWQHVTLVRLIILLLLGKRILLKIKESVSWLVGIKTYSWRSILIIIYHCANMARRVMQKCLISTIWTLIKVNPSNFPLSFKVNQFCIDWDLLYNMLFFNYIRSFYIHFAVF